MMTSTLKRTWLVSLAGSGIDRQQLRGQQSLHHRHKDATKRRWNPTKFISGQTGREPTPNINKRLGAIISVCTPKYKAFTQSGRSSRLVNHCQRDPLGLNLGNDKSPTVCPTCSLLNTSKRSEPLQVTIASTLSLSLFPLFIYSFF